MVYCPGQVANLFPYIDFTPQWFLLGGPADGDEAQVFKAKYPKAHVFGFEPNPVLWDYQKAVGFPGTLLKVALWSEAGNAQLSLGTNGDDEQRHRTSSIVRPYPKHGYLVELITLDQLERLYGPWHDVILWLDIEGAELNALQGASKLLSRATVRLINLEVFNDQKDTLGSLLAHYGYQEVGTWGRQGDIRPDGRNWWNAIYALKGE